MMRLLTERWRRRLLLAALLYCLAPGRAAAEDSTAVWQHRYHHTLVMKMLMAVPDGKGGSVVYTTFEKALQLIRETDQLTLQAPKIIYLVGWQYNGHDDRYPAFFEVNRHLKRKEDATARESLIWLMNEAKKYNTTVSLHINMTDAYEDSPLWDAYAANDLISRNEAGERLVIGNYNNRKAYQINYRNEWKKGYAQMRIDSLIALLPPLRAAGTIHLDAWIARESKGHNESVITEADYQRKVCRYWLEKGIDPTTEWAMDYMEGLVPFYWHFNRRTQADYLATPAAVCTGSHLNPDVKKSDFGLEFLFGTSMYGENIFPNERNNTADATWAQPFCREFYLNFLQYYYLNSLQRLRVEGSGAARVAYFSGGVQVSLKDSTVHAGGRLLRTGNRICFPVLWKNGPALAAYSDQAAVFDYGLPEGWGTVKRVAFFRVGKNGLTKTGAAPVKGNTLKLTLPPGTPVLILPENIPATASE